MSISAAQKHLVQSSFALVEPIAEQAAEIFYNRLFELDPSLKPLFKSDIKSQGKKLMSTLKVAVKSLDNLDALVPVLQQLAERHVDYGVTEQHYHTVGQALLDTLQAGLGEGFTQEVKAAWTAVYTLVAQVMTEHVREPDWHAKLAELNRATRHPWEMRNNALYKNFQFGNFITAFGFMSQVALLSEQVGHHPDWKNVGGNVDIRLMDHHHKRLSEKDFALAKLIDQLPLAKF